MLCSAIVDWKYTYDMFKGRFCFECKKNQVSAKYFGTCYAVYCTTQCMNYRKSAFQTWWALESH